MNEAKEYHASEGRLLHNSIRTPDGTILTSRHRHDYRTYVDANGQQYMVDGGLDYLRRNVHEDFPYEELSLTEDDPHEVLRLVIDWGVLRDGEHTFIPINQLSRAHIENIIKDGYQGRRVDLMKNELQYRTDTESKSEAKRKEAQRENSYG